MEQDEGKVSDMTQQLNSKNSEVSNHNSEQDTHTLKVKVKIGSEKLQKVWSCLGFNILSFRKTSEKSEEKRGCGVLTLKNYKFKARCEKQFIQSLEKISWLPGKQPITTN